MALIASDTEVLQISPVPVGWPQETNDRQLNVTLERKFSAYKWPLFKSNLRNENYKQQQ